MRFLIMGFNFERERERGGGVKCVLKKTCQIYIVLRAMTFAIALYKLVNCERIGPFQNWSDVCLFICTCALIHLTFCCNH